MHHHFSEKRFTSLCTFPFQVLFCGILLLLTTTAQAAPQYGNQEKLIQVRGVVSTEDGLPLENVYVQAKGAKSHTLTDAEGGYRLTVDANGTLIFSFIGFTAMEEPINGRTEVNVLFKEWPDTMSEVVITGYQTISKERTTGAFAKVTSEQLSTHRLSNLNTLLEGQVAGYSEGYIRGISTMNANKVPLYVIDGFPVENTSIDGFWTVTENLPDINLEDIESITVLKDAAAASIYGARAANGVIVITTKKAKQGKMQVGFSSTFLWRPYSYYTDHLTNSADIISLEKQWAAENPELHNGLARAQAEANNRRNNAAWPSQGVNTLLDLYTGVITPAQADAKLNDLASRGYAYYDDVARYAKRDLFMQQYNFNIAKASEQYNFVASVSYKHTREESAYAKDGQLGVNMANSLKLNKWLTLDLGGFLSYKDATTPTYGLYEKNQSGYAISPYDRLIDDNGNHITMPSQVRKIARDNIATYKLYDVNITPLDELGRCLDQSNGFNSRTYAKLTIKPLTWLSYNAMFQYEYGVIRKENLLGMDSYITRGFVNTFATQSGGKVTYNIPVGDVFYTQNNFSNGYSFRQQLNIDKTLADVHALTFILGSEIRDAKQEYNDRTLYGYDPKMLTFQYINQPMLTTGFTGLMNTYAYLPDWQLGLNSEMVNRFVSLYANGAYTYKQRYAFTGSIRWDRSNLWATNLEYQKIPFWSVGASWNANRESFFQVSWINMLKLRASYGTGGNIAKDASPYLVASYYPSSLVGGTYGTVDLPPNPKLCWEQTTTANIGVDFALFKNRLSGSIDVYNKNGKDLLANQMGIATEGFGYTLLKINNGAMRNRGIEVTLQGKVVQSRSFSWNTSLLFAYNNNEVTDVKIKAPSYFMQMSNPKAYPVVGNAYAGIYAYKWAGLNANGDTQIYDANGNVTSTSYQNLNQVYYVGTAMPPYSGSFTNTVSYKNLDFSVMLIYEAGHKLKNTSIPTINISNTNLVGMTNGDIRYRWQKAGDELLTDVPRVRIYGTTGYNDRREIMYNHSDIHVLNASNVRISNVALAYHLPQTWCKKVCMSNVKLQLNIENLAMFTYSRDAKRLLGGYIKPNYICGLYVNL